MQYFCSLSSKLREEFEVMDDTSKNLTRKKNKWPPYLNLFAIWKVIQSIINICRLYRLKKFRTYIPRSVLRGLERMRYRSGDGRRSDCNELKSQWRPSKSRKESILNCLLMGRWCFICKMREISDQGDRIEKYRTSWKRVGYWREINAGVKAKATCLGELTTEGEKEAKQPQPVWNDFELKSKKYRSSKKRGNEHVLQNIYFVQIDIHSNYSIQCQLDHTFKHCIVEFAFLCYGMLICWPILSDFRPIIKNWILFGQN